MSKIYRKGGIVADQKDCNSMWQISFNVTTPSEYIQYYTTSGKIWTLMETRCGGKSTRYSIEKPTYKNCTNDFRDFQKFVEWCHSQNGYLLKDDQDKIWQLDKDILIMGNKSYSPETCAFVPAYINGLFVCCQKKGELPLGVHYREKFQKYVSQINFQGKRAHLGHFDDPLKAHVAWQKAKIESIYLATERYRNTSGAREDIVNSLLARIDILKQDMSNGQETMQL